MWVCSHAYLHYRPTHPPPVHRPCQVFWRSPPLHQKFRWCRPAIHHPSNLCSWFSASGLPLNPLLHIYQVYTLFSVGYINCLTVPGIRSLCNIVLPCGRRILMSCRSTYDHICIRRQPLDPLVCLDERCALPYYTPILPTPPSLSSCFIGLSVYRGHFCQFPASL